MVLLERYKTPHLPTRRIHETHPVREFKSQSADKAIQVPKRGQRNSNPKARTRQSSQISDNMAVSVSLPTFPAFQVHLDGNVGHRWKKWLARFDNLIVSMGIEDALLLHYSGPEVDEIFDTLENTGEEKDYKTAVEKRTAHFNPQVNTTYEVYNFRKAQQNEGESLDSFHTRLRTLAKTCEFGDADKEIKEQIILSCKSNALRWKALREDLDLTVLLKAGRALELSETQAKEVESEKTTVNTIKHKKKNETCSKKGKGRRREQHSKSRSESHKESRKSDESSKCKNAEVAPTPTTTPALLETRSAPPVASSIILLKFVGQFHPVQ